MTKPKYPGPERRKFIRLEYITPLAFKVCNPQTISKMLQGYIVDISEAGLLCHMTSEVKKDDIIWLSFDRGMLDICQDIEKRCFIYQSGIIGKVARIERQPDGSFNVGIQFMIREEKHLDYIYPKIHFLKDKFETVEPEEDEEEEVSEEREESEDRVNEDEQI